jgi:hypothetical protein
MKPGGEGLKKLPLAARNGMPCSFIIEISYLK